jgi:D-arabinose 1-dehydrogenase-like Zn-dependent alcohol dehydrogenase
MSESSMRALQGVKAGGASVLTSLPVPDPGAGQVRIKVYACGVCGGDNVARLGLQDVQLPRVPGHEIAGVIDAVGPGVTVWK